MNESMAAMLMSRAMTGRVAMDATVSSMIAVMCFMVYKCRVLLFSLFAQ